MDNNNFRSERKWKTKKEVKGNKSQGRRWKEGKDKEGSEESENQESERQRRSWNEATERDLYALSKKNMN